MLRTFLIACTLAFILVSQAMAHSPQQTSSTNPHAHHMPAGMKMDSRAALAAARQQNAAGIGKGQFTLTDQNGRPVTEKNLKGKYTLLFFGFTRCDDECPTALSLLTEVYEQLPPQKQARLQVVMVSVDGEHDTPEVLRQYVANFNPAFQGWTGTPAQIDTITQEFVAYYAIVPGAEDPSGPAPSTYQVAHSAFIYLMDDAGEYVGHFSHKEKPETLLSAVETTIQ